MPDIEVVVIRTPLIQDGPIIGPIMSVEGEQAIKHWLGRGFKIVGQSIPYYEEVKQSHPFIVYTLIKDSSEH